MSDQENLSITASGSGKSEAEVAFDLVSKLKGQGVWGERNQSDILDMYAECLDATRGLRAYPGQRRIDTPIDTPSGKPQVQAAPIQPAQAPQNQAPQGQAPQNQAAHSQAVHAQAQAAHAQAQAAQLQHTRQQQAVHAQQHAIQQAYKG